MQKLEVIDELSWFNWFDDKLQETIVNTLKLFQNEQDMFWLKQPDKTLQPTNPNFGKESWRLSNSY